MDDQLDDLFGSGDYWEEQQQQQQQQQEQPMQSGSEDTDESELSWEEDVSYEWVIRRIGLLRANICLVSRGDPREAYRFVVFHFEEVFLPANHLSLSLPHFLAFRRDDGLHPDALNRVYSRVRLWWIARFGTLPEAVEAQAHALLVQHEQEFAAAQAGPLALGDLGW
ncbi:hypothetical protein B484DRAFT_433356 [Ochromonadaceae sp. CCMP2298]|nr:hypothetical protein B484DRAFT_433356 [Ochromonadaceae sp. CCMP2298]